MKKYDKQSILNLVSCKGSVMTEEGIKKAQKDKETAKKATLFTLLLLFCGLSLLNAVQWSDLIARILFIVQIIVILVWLLVSRFYFGIKFNMEIPKNKPFQIFGLTVFITVADLMYIGCFRIVDRNLNSLIPAGMIFLVICCSFIYERMRILRAIEKNEGIMNRAFETVKDLSTGGVYAVVMIITGIASGGNLGLFEIILVVAATVITLMLSRSLTHNIYRWYFAKKYGLEDELFKNVL